jgi:diguanylate cyclase (GGDEF)-like protein
MDLFAHEQQIYRAALKRIEDVRNGAPFDFEEFPALVKEYGRVLNLFRKITKFSDGTMFDLFEVNRDLIDKVQHDALTGLYNRRYLEEAVKRIIRYLSRANGVLSLMVLDVDFFKNYNDIYGHSAGDFCLKILAEIFVKSITREDDFVARYGGEEFVLVLPHTDEHGAHLTASRLLERVIERDLPHEANEAAGCVTVSIGVTTVKVKHTHKAEDYIKRADEALYTSKKNGRNRYTYLKFKEEAE